MDILTKIQGCLLGVMLGDAMGMPTESMSAEAILEKTSGVGIKDFVDPMQIKVRDTARLPAGSTTDDWQLTEAILRSLLRRKCFDLSDIALSHVEAYETSTFGWGGTTRGGLAELKAYFDSRGTSGRSPFDNPIHRQAGSSRGCGNGVAMKIAPVALFSVITQNQIKENDIVHVYDDTIAFEFPYLAERVAAIGRLTHYDTRSWAAAYAVALIIAETMVFSHLAPKLSDREHRSWLLGRIIKKVEKFEKKYPSTESDLFSLRLRKLHNDVLLYGSIDELRKEVGVGCIALESVCFSIACFLRQPFDFDDALLEAVNAGGDTDTTAAMVGSMVGAVVGVEGIPEKWIGFSPEFSLKAIEMSKEFVNI